ncbi:MAG: CDP-alcohol phosphatidyltransferase family protein [Desulfobacterales bacterium]
MDASTIKSAVEKRLAPALVHVPLHPHVVTLLALASALAAAGLLVRGQAAAAGMLVVLSGSLDLLDGAIAKARCKATAFGALLDRVSDRLADFAVVSAILGGGHVPFGWGLLALLSVMLGSYISACIEAETHSRIGESVSLRGLRILLLALACLTQRFTEAVILLAALGALSAVGRMVLAWRLLGDRGQA